MKMQILQLRKKNTSNPNTIAVAAPNAAPELIPSV